LLYKWRERKEEFIPQCSLAVDAIVVVNVSKSSFSEIAFTVRGLVRVQEIVG